MNIKKIIIIALAILLLSTATILTVLGANNMRRTRSMREFNRIIEQGELDDITLTIYFSGLAFIHGSITVDHVIEFHHYKAVVDGARLTEHIELLKELSNVDLRPSRNEWNFLKLNVYYIFETSCGRKLLDVAMWINDYDVIVNGFEVRGYDIFSDVIIPFLPEDIVRSIEYRIGRRQYY